MVKDIDSNKISSDDTKCIYEIDEDTPYLGMLGFLKHIIEKYNDDAVNTRGCLLYLNSNLINEDNDEDGEFDDVMARQHSYSRGDTAAPPDTAEMTRQWVMGCNPTAPTLVTNCGGNYHYKIVFQVNRLHLETWPTSRNPRYNTSSSHTGRKN